MRSWVSVLAFGVLMACLPAVAQEAAPASAVPVPAVAPEMWRDARCGQFIARCRVNGHPARLMVDTGATHTVLAADFVARELPQLERVEGVRLSGNARVAPELAVASVEAGGAALRRSHVLVMDLSGVNSLLAEPVEGILGMAQLCQLPFTLDLRAGGGGYWGELAPPCPSVRLEGRADAAGRLYVPTRAEGGSACLLLLDTGSSTTTWPAGQWGIGAQAADAVSRLRVADVNGARDTALSRGGFAELELPGGVRLPAVAPLLQAGQGSHVLGLDALGGCLLIHRPGEGFFLALPRGNK